jgi:DNA primase
MFYDFEDIKARTDILQVAADLGLQLRKSGVGYRSACPACDTDDKRGLVITPGKGFYCFDQMKGGDVIGLVAHILYLGMKEAAGWLTEMYGLGTVQETRTVNRKNHADVPQNERGGAQSAHPFDAEGFAAKLTYTKEVEELGISQEDAKRLSIGFCSAASMRGRVCFPIRSTAGVIVGFIGWNGTDLKVPKTFLADNVVRFPRSA